VDVQWGQPLRGDPSRKKRAKESGSVGWNPKTARKRRGRLEKANFVETTGQILNHNICHKKKGHGFTETLKTEENPSRKRKAEDF